MSASAVVQAVYDRLAGDTGTGGLCNVTTGIGTRLYHLTGPENVVLPACVFVVSADGEPQRYFDGTSHEKFTAAFSIWVPLETSTDVAAMTLDEALYARLRNQDLTATGYDRIHARCVRRGTVQVDEDTFRVDSDYELRGQFLS